MIIQITKEITTGIVYEHVSENGNFTEGSAIGIKSGERYRPLGIQVHVESGYFVTYAVISTTANSGIGTQVMLVRDSSYDLVDSSLPMAWKILSQSKTSMTIGFEIIRDLESLHSKLFNNDKEAIRAIRAVSEN